jgi:hypothetical protein
MKKAAWFIGALMITGALFLQGSPDTMKGDQLPGFVTVFKYPADVMKVIDQKCYGCHSVKGQSDDAKDALMWDDLPKLDKASMIATLDAIIGVLEDGTMPPEDVIKKYPEAKVLPEERRILKGWAEAKADSLLN